MQYYISKIVTGTYEDTLGRVVDALKAQGFGVLTEIDVKETLKKKLNVDFRKYKILGACNPPFAYQALQAEEHVGVLMPCNVIVQELADGQVEVAAVDPLMSMEATGNPKLKPFAEQVHNRLQAMIDSL